MIEKPTVFILGAGASCAFGFPLGSELRDQVVTTLDGPYRTFGAIHQYYGYKFFESTKEWVWTHNGRPPKTRQEIESEITAFKESLWDSPLSIDAFLENRTEFEEVGKIAIAAILILNEKASELMRKPHEDSRWIDELFKKMRASPTDFANNQVSIITFNYDRSVEYFFWKALKSTYGLAEEEAAKLLESVPIVHIHGQLGKPHFLASDGRDYVTDRPQAALRTAVDNMRIIHQQPDESPEYQRAHEMIAQAEILCFLGFGYHPVNMRRLAVKDHFRGERILGTCYGMEANERRLARNRIGFNTPDIHKYMDEYNKPLEVVLGDQTEDARIFLSKRPVFDN